MATMATKKSGKPKKDVVLAFRVPTEIKEAVEKKAAADGRSLANYIAWLVTRDVADEKKK